MFPDNYEVDGQMSFEDLEQNELKTGDTIKCKDGAELADLMVELEKEGYTTDFMYEKDGVKGLWLEILKGVEK